MTPPIPLDLGVDLATAHARVVAVAEDGSVVAERQADLPPVRQPREGWREQDADHLGVVLRLLHDLAADLGDRSAEVRALSLSGTSGTAVPCDRSGRPTGPAVMYHDQRAEAEAARLRAAGIAAGATAPMARIGHLVHRGAALVLATPDVVHAGLLGRVVAADTSHTLKAGVDAEHRRWDARALAALAVPPDALPDLVHPGTVLGSLSARASRATGLSAKVRVVSGMTDGCTAQVAAGAVAAGDSVGVLGTTLVLKAVADHEVRGLGGALYSHYAPDGSWWAGGAANVGAGPVREEYAAGDDDLAALEAAARDHGPATAVAYPLRGTGERFPLDRPDARGFVVGDPGSRAGEFRAFLEGVAFVERLGLDTLRAHGVAVKRHHLAGGGARSALWSRIRATVLDVPTLLSPRTSSAYGAALLARSTVAGRPLADVVAEVAGDDEPVAPLDRERDRLEAGLDRFRDEMARRGLLDPRSPTPREEP